MCLWDRLGMGDLILDLTIVVHRTVNPIFAQIILKSFWKSLFSRLAWLFLKTRFHKLFNKISPNQQPKKRPINVPHHSSFPISEKTQDHSIFSVNSKASFIILLRTNNCCRFRQTFIHHPAVWMKIINIKCCGKRWRKKKSKISHFSCVFESFKKFFSLLFRFFWK